MNNKIKELQAKLLESKADIAAIDRLIQLEYNKVFDDSTKLKNAIKNAENSSEYQVNCYGEIESWWRFRDLSDYTEARDYLDNWFSDYCIVVDWENECLLVSQGESIIIQDDTRHDNGVWLNGKCIIKESEYKLDNEVNEDKRNELIEIWMDKNGFFPGVFRVDSYGNVFPVQTKK